MNVRSNTPVLLGGWLTDAGHVLAKTARGIVDVGKSVRGDTDPMLIEKDVGPATSTQIIYGMLAVVGLYLVVRK